ncbi:signal peptidase I [Wolffia australiana]
MKAKESVVFSIGTLALAIVASFAIACNSSALPPTVLLQDVVKAIARKEGWEAKAARVSKFASGSVRVARARRLELQIRGRLVLTFPEELDGGAWRRPRRRGRERAWRKLDGPLRWPRPRLNQLDLIGPLEVKAIGADRLSIFVPEINTTRAGLKRIVVGGGIGVAVTGAEGFTMRYPSGGGGNRKPSFLRAPSVCPPPISVTISGQPSLTASKVISISSPSPETLELHPAKCYGGSQSQNPPLPFPLSNVLEGVLRKGVRARMTPSAMVRFKLELERKIGEDDVRWREAPEWKSRPAMERDWFEVLTRAGPGTSLKPVYLRKLERSPVLSWGSPAWLDSFLPNVSLSQFLSFLLPPEAFMLDVKW